MSFADHIGLLKGATTMHKWRCTSNNLFRLVLPPYSQTLFHSVSRSYFDLSMSKKKIERERV